MESPIFVRFSLFLTSTHFENLIHPALTVQKFKILVALFGGTPFGNPKFYEILSIINIYLP